MHVHVSFSLFKWTYFSSHFCLLFWIVVRHCKYSLGLVFLNYYKYSWALFWHYSKFNWKQFGSLGSCKICLGIVMVAGARLGDGGWKISSRPGYPDLHEILFQDITITTITTPKKESTEDLLGRTRPVFRQWLILPKSCEFPDLAGGTACCCWKIRYWFFLHRDSSCAVGASVTTRTDRVTICVRQEGNIIQHDLLGSLVQTARVWPWQFIVGIVKYSTIW